MHSLGPSSVFGLGADVVTDTRFVVSESDGDEFTGCIVTGGCGYRDILGNKPSMGE